MNDYGKLCVPPDGTQSTPLVSCVIEWKDEMSDSPPTCAHCGAPLSKWTVPMECAWDEEWFYVCFNDECS